MCVEAYGEVRDGSTVDPELRLPIVSIPASKAMAQLRAGAARSKWPDLRTPGKPLEGVADVACAPTFEIHPDDQIFTVGSCFARNIEFRLEEIGFSTPMYNPGVRAKLAELGEALPFFNKYNVSVIRSELEWAAGVARPPEEQVLLPLPDGAVQEGFFNPRNKGGVSVEEARARRAYVAGLFSRFPECRIFIMTLGLVEVWRDLKTGLRLNVIPRALIDAEPDRFVLDVLSYEEVLSELEAIHALLARHGHPEVKVLITVSPVPLSRTFRPIDVISANTYSKSVQRAAVETFVTAHENVDYFPSYETVTLTDRRLAFESDNRHVQAGVVARIVDRFLRAYSPDLQFADTNKPLVESDDNPRSAEDLLYAAKMQMAARQYAIAANSLGRLIAKFGDRHKFITTAELRLRFGTSLAKTGMRDLAQEQFRLAAKAEDGEASLLLKCADKLLSCGDAEAAAGALNKAQLLDAPEPELMVRRARLFMAASQTGAAAELLTDLLARQDLDQKLRNLASSLLESGGPARALEHLAPGGAARHLQQAGGGEAP
jgi:hypothetical protein